MENQYHAKIHNEAYVPNIVGIRTKDPTDEFNDKLLVFWKNDQGEWESQDYTITTDPGKDALLHPEEVNTAGTGTAILAEGYYPRAFKKGIHKKGLKDRTKSKAYQIFRPVLSKKLRERFSHLARSHKALIQAGNLRIYRDNSGDEVLDFDGTTEEGQFCINLHRSDAEQAMENVGGYSAGCQVFQDPKEYEHFMDLMQGKLKQDFYDYTLINKKDLETHLEEEKLNEAIISRESLPKRAPTSKSLESVVTFISASGFILSLIFLSGMTGNVVSNFNLGLKNTFGVIMFLLGVFGTFLLIKIKKK